MGRDIRLFAKHRGAIYRMVQDDEGRIAYIRSDKSEMWPSDQIYHMPDHVAMIGSADNAAVH